MENTADMPSDADAQPPPELRHTIDIAWEYPKPHFIHEAKLIAWTSAAMNIVCRYSQELSILMCGKTRMQELNKQFRNVDRPTDVLSFPYEDNLGDGVLLGDIAICIPVIHDQSSEYGHPFDMELKMMMAHGLLHLLGYDHESDEEARIMEARERAINEELGGIALC